MKNIFNMKYRKLLFAAIFIVLLLLLCGGNVFAQDSGFGIGVILGEPTGLSAKLWLTDTTAIDFAAAWSFYRNEGNGNDNSGALYLHANFLYHFKNIINVKSGEFDLYTGIGGKVAFGDDFYMAVRVPIGLLYMFEKAPFDVFVEVSPALALVPGTGFDLGAAIGGRYWFK